MPIGSFAATCGTCGVKTERSFIATTFWNVNLDDLTLWSSAFEESNCSFGSLDLEQL